MSEVVETAAPEAAPETNVNPAESSEAVESAPSSEAAESQKDEFAAKFAALTREDRKVRDKERELEAKMRAFEEEQAAYKEQLNAKSEPEVPLEWRLKQDPINTLKEFGLDFNTLTDLALNDGKLTPEMKIQLLEEQLNSRSEQINKTVEEKIKNLEDQLAAKEEAAAQEEYERTVQGFMGEITEVMNSSEEYELVRANDGADLVYEVVEQHYKDTLEETGTGEILPVEDALQYTENWLMEKYKSTIGGASKLTKLFGEQSSPEPQAPERKSQTTLSNTLASQVPHREKRPMTEDDYKRAAMSKLKFLE